MRASKQANGLASGPVLASGFLVVLHHSEKQKNQGRIHGNPCRGRLGRGSDKLGRGSKELGRGSNELDRAMKGCLHSKSKV